MRIKAHPEFFRPSPILNANGNLDALFTQLLSSQDPENIQQLLRDGLTVPIVHLISLNEWTNILNKLDELLETLIVLCRPLLFVPQQPNLVETETFLKNRLSLCYLLDFLGRILENAYEKEVFNSVEHLIELLGSSDTNVAVRSLTCLYHLASLPLGNRVDRYITKTTTILQKNPDHFSAIFEILSASSIGASLKDLCAAEYVPPQEFVLISVANSDGRPDFTFTFSPSDQRDIGEILTAQDASQFTLAQKMSFLWSSRFRHQLFGGWEGRLALVELRLKALLVLLVHPDKSLLFKFFQDKLEILKDLVWLLANVPETLGSSPVDRLLPLRVLAIQCLSVALDSRDSSSPPLFLHFPWLLDDLGVSRGQYLGIIPCLIRYAISSLLPLKALPSHSQDQRQVLLWIENFFALIAVMMNISSAIPALVDNGLVDALITVLKSSCCKLFADQTNPSLLVYIDTMCIDILEAAFCHYPKTLPLFKEMSGIDALIHRLYEEMQQFLDSSVLWSNPEIFQRKLLVQYLVSLLTTFVQESKNDITAGEEQQFEFYQNQQFIFFLENVFLFFDRFTAVVLSTTITLVTELINKDPSPPTILNFFLNSTTVFHKALDVFSANRQRIGSIDQELPNILTNFVSAISLSKEGTVLVVNSNVIPNFLSLYLDERYFYPNSQDLMLNDVSIAFGKNLEQLMRHYPESYQKIILDSVSHGLDSLFQRAAGFCRASNEIMEEDSGFLNFNEDYAKIVNSTLGLMTCLEQLLEKKGDIKEFITQNNGFRLLSQVKQISLGPSRFLLISSASNQLIQDEFSRVNPLALHNSYSGYPPLDASIHRCFEKIAIIHDSKLVFDFAFESLSEYLQQLETLLGSYWSFLSSSDCSKDFSVEKGKKRKRGKASKNENSDPDDDETGKLQMKNEAPRFLDGFFESSPNDSFEVISPPSTLQQSLQWYAKVLRHVALLDFTVGLLGFSLSSTNRHGRTNINMESFKSLTSSPDMMDRLRYLLRKVYFPLLSELSRAKSEESRLSFAATETEIDSQPNFVVRVLNENIVVRDSFEDPGKRLYKLPKGIHLISSERKITPVSSVLKYRVEDGWISSIRGNSLATHIVPQLLVVDVLPKTSGTSAESSSATATTTRFSAKKSGLFIFGRFHSTVKHVFLSVFPKMIRVHEGEQESIFQPRADAPISTAVAPMVNFYLDFFDFLLPPQLSADFSLAQYLREQETQINSSSTAPSYPDAASLVDHLIETKFTVQSPHLPSMQEVSLQKIHFSCRLFDLFQAFLLDNKQSQLFSRQLSRQEFNSLFLIHFFYRQGLFRRCLEVSTEIFRCALNPFILSVSDSALPHASADFADFPESFLHFSEEELQTIQKENPSPSQDQPFSRYLELRREHLERRKVALHALPRIFEVWKQFFTAISLSSSTFERTLHELSDAEHEYNPEVFKREMLLELIRFLSNTWFHPLVHTLPPTLSRSLLDVLNIATKSLQLAKLFPVKPPKPVGSAPRPVRRSTTRNPVNPRSLFGMLRSSVTAPPAFQVSEETVNTLVEMGFSRNNCVNAIQMTRTNDVNQLVPLLLDNFDGFLSMHQLGQAATPAPPEPVEEPLPAEEMQVVSTTTNDSERVTSEFSKPAEPILPTVTLPTDSDLSLQKDFLPRMIRFTLSRMKNLFLDMISFTSSENIELFEKESHLFHVNLPQQTKINSREAFTFSVLTQMLKLFEGSYHLSEGLVRLIQIRWFYNRILTELSGGLNDWKPSRLFGLTHAVLILLSTRISGGATIKSAPEGGRQQTESSGIELILLILRLDPDCEQTHNKLFDCLRQVSSLDLEKESQGSLKNLTAFASTSLLLFDALHQNVVVDRDNLPAQMNEIDGMYKLNSGCINDFAALDCRPENLFSSTVKLRIRREYLEKGAQITDSSNSLDEMVPDSPEAKISLPLVHSGLSEQVQQQLSEICLRFLSVVSSLARLKTADSAVQDTAKSLGLDNFLRALVQLIIHLEAEEGNRRLFVERNVHTSLLDLLSRLKLEGMQPLSRTIFQRQFEDSNYLQQLMTSTMKISYEKVLAQPSGKGSGTGVRLTSFLELVAPLIYRNQQIFLSCLLSHYSLFKTGDSLYIISKDKEKAPMDSESKDEAQGAKVSLILAKLVEANQLAVPDNVARQQRQNVVHELIQSVCTALAVKIQTLNSAPFADTSANQTAASPAPKNTESFLAISDLLLLLAELIATLPVCTYFVAKFRTPATVTVPNAITQQSMQKISVVALLFHQILFHPHFDNSTVTSAAEETKAAVREEEELLDQCAYFLAALLFRPGEGRKLVLDEVLQILNLRPEVLQPFAVKESFARFLQFLQNVIHPPAKWVARDSFLVPVKDVVTAINEKRIFQRLIDVFTHLEISAHNCQMKPLEQLGSLLDSLLKKSATFSFEVPRSDFSSPLVRRKSVDGQLSAPVSQVQTRLDSLHTLEPVISSQPSVPPSQQVNESFADLNEDLGVAAFEQMAQIERSAVEPAPSESSDDLFGDDDEEEDDEPEDHFETLEEEEERGSPDFEHIHEGGDSEDSEDEDDLDEDGARHMGDPAHDHEHVMELEDVSDEDGSEQDDIDQEDDDDDEDHDPHIAEHDHFHGDGGDEEEADAEEGAMDIDDDRAHDEDEDEEDESMDGDEDDAEREMRERIEQEITQEGDDMDEAEEDGQSRHEEDDDEAGDGENDENLLDDIPNEASDLLHEVGAIEHDEGQTSSSEENEGEEDHLFMPPIPHSRAGHGRRHVIHNLIGTVEDGELRLTMDSSNINDIFGSLLNSQDGPSALSFRSDGDGMRIEIGNEALEAIHISQSAVDARTGRLIPIYRSSQSSQPPNNQPLAHPLLSMVDSRRRSRPTSSVNPLPSFLSSSLGSSRSEPYFTLAKTTPPLPGHKRRQVNPLVSERRWGTDVGELESAKSRIKSLVRALEWSLQDLFPQKSSSSSSNNNKSLGASTDKQHLRSLVDILSRANSFRDSSLLSEISGPPSFLNDSFLQEESKEEGPLQESKEDDEHPDPSLLSSFLLPPRLLESSLPARRAQRQLPPSTHPEVNITPAPAQAPASAAPAPAPVTTPAPAPALAPVLHPVPTTETVTTANALESNDNLLFIESLPADLRQEVLISAEESFLLTLPPALREEARLLREQNSMDMLFADIPRDSPRRTAPVVTTANPPAPASSSTAQPPVQQLVTINPTDITSPPALTVSTSQTAVPVSSTPATPATPAKIEPTLADPNLYVKLGESFSEQPQFSSAFLQQLLTWVHSVRLAKAKSIPSSLLRLLVTVSKYDQVRPAFLQLLFDLMLSERRVHLPADFEALGRHLKDSLGKRHEESLAKLVQWRPSVTEKEQFLKFLLMLGHLLKKTDSVVWYALMTGGVEGESSVLFSSLIEMTRRITESDGMIEFSAMIRLLERICHPFTRLSPSQVALLVQERQKARSSGDAMEVDESSGPADAREKRVSFSVPALPNSNTAEGKKEAEDPKRQLLPFPVLSGQDAQVLCRTILFTDCYHHQHHHHHDHHNSGLRKSLIRTMRSLALFDGNWKRLLSELALVGRDLMKKTVTEFLEVHQSLLEAASHGEDSATILTTRSPISRPKNLFELKLLNILQFMTSLRKKKLSSNGSIKDVSSSSQEEENEEIVSGAMRRMSDDAVGSESSDKIEAEQLWDVLHDCLDLIREIETAHGSDSAEGEDKDEPAASKRPAPTISTGPTPASSNSQSLAKAQQNISALTMRFIPLIECYLTVFSHTMLVKGGSAGLAGHSGSHTHTSPTAASGSGQHHQLATSPEGTELVRTNSIIPGARFRQNNPNAKILSVLLHSNQSMEIRDELAAAAFFKFLEKNTALLNQILQQNRVHLLDSSFSILMKVHRCRSFLSFDNKRLYFKSKLKQLIKVMASRRGQFSSGHLRIAVRRSHVFEESFQLLRSKSVDEMRKKLNITFLEEEGIDASGLTREWYTILAKEIFNPNYALFSLTSDGITFQPNAQSSINNYHLDYFKFIGRIIGKAICDSQLLDIHFTRSFYKHILGLNITLSDLESIDQEYYKSMMTILETPLDVMGLDGELTFSLEENEFGKITVVELIPNGNEVLVTDQNKAEYVHLLAHHRMTSAIRRQIDSFLEGFYELVPYELISIFDAHELELLISGLPEIDFHDLRANTDYYGYSANDLTIQQFWNVLKSFSKEEKVLFIQFVTGSSKVPLEGFKALPGANGIKKFNIHKAYGAEQGLLPAAHTCFNQLDLPEYVAEDVMREKLLIAIKEGSEGFGLA